MPYEILKCFIHFLTAAYWHLLLLHLNNDWLFQILAKKKNEQIQSGIDQLKHKYKELELGIEEQKKKLNEYANIHSVTLIHIA